MDKKKKFNVIDVIIIVAALVILGVSVYRGISLSNSKNLTTKKDITYTVTVHEISSVYADSLKEGEQIYLEGTGLKSGTVSGITTKYYYETIQVTNDEGITLPEKRINPSKIELIVNIDVNGQFADAMIYIGQNTYFSEGQRVTFYSDTFTFTGIVSNFVETTAE